MKIWSYTFGCKVNQYETELLRHRISSPGDTLVKNPEEADLCLVNTCTVTQFADKECRQLIRKVLRANTTARVIVTGCYATRDSQEIKDISPRLEVYTNQEKNELPSCIGFEVADKPLGIHQFAGRTRAFLKIQDGCKAPCNYCIIPTVRPDMTSKTVTQVLEEVNALLDHGYQEIVLTGIRLGLYRGVGEGGNKIDLLSLLKIITAIPRKFRIRLSSLEVTEVTDELIDFVSKNSKICRHFHIPMQSGNSEVLKNMRRWYNADFYMERVEKVRSVMPDCGVTADVMVGYPTETEEQFMITYENIKKMNLSGLHVFRFSAREGTPAATLKPLQSSHISERAERLGKLDKELREAFYRRFEGATREVLPEPSGEGWSDNYIRVDVPLNLVPHGMGTHKISSHEYPPIALSI